MNQDFQFRDKIAVAVLGVEEQAAQQLIARLSRHPWFQLVALPGDPSGVPSAARLYFSHPKAVAGLQSERNLVLQGHAVISCTASADSSLVCVAPDVNVSYLKTLRPPPRLPGVHVRVPSVGAAGLALALKPLDRLFGIEAAHIVILKSAAAFADLASLEVIDNVIPVAEEDENRLVGELMTLLDTSEGETSRFPIAAQEYCLPMSCGEVLCVSVRLKKKSPLNEVRRAWNDVHCETKRLRLPSAPEIAIHYWEEGNYPQPRLQGPMKSDAAIHIGRLRPSAVFDYQFTMVPTASVADPILLAELMVAYGLVYW